MKIIELDNAQCKRYCGYVKFYKNISKIVKSNTEFDLWSRLRVGMRSAIDLVFKSLSISEHNSKAIVEQKKSRSDQAIQSES